VGVIAYEMIAGKRPRGIFASPGGYCSWMPKSAENAIMRALNEDPEMRDKSALEFYYWIMPENAPDKRKLYEQINSKFYPEFDSWKPKIGYKKPKPL
jgi:hypothetical protein